MKINIILTDDKGNQFSGEVGLVKVTDSKKVKKIKKIKEDQAKPIYSIKKMYLSGFFKNEKDLGSVNSELETTGYNFKKGSIQYALDSSEFLERKGKKGDYKWIQKYPPS